MYDEYAVAPVDIANGNTPFIYKRFFIEVPIKQFGIGPGSVSKNSDTYKMHLINDCLGINQHPEYLYKYVKLKVIEEKKFDKNLTRARFIPASQIFSLKPLAKSITCSF